MNPNLPRLIYGVAIYDPELIRSSDPRVLCEVRFFDSELVVVLPAGQLSTRADPQAKSENT